jgi:hypothetical protein
MKTVKTTAERTSILPTVLVCDNTDLLFLGWFHAIAIPTRYVILQK